MLLAFPAAASAHANLVRTVPADRARLTTAPSVVRVTFDDPVQVGPGTDAVRNGGGSVLAGTPVAHGKTLEVPLRAGLGTGVYSVRRSIISDDGHNEAGVPAFAVGATAAPEPSLRAGVHLRPSTVVSRWVFLTALLIAAGLVLFELIVWRPVTGRWLPLGWLGAALAAVGVSALALVHERDAGVSTRFGLALVIAAAVAGAGVVACIAGRFAPTCAVALVAALALLPVPTVSGHALDAGRSWVDVPIDLLHVVTAAFWLGSLVALAVVVPHETVDLDRRCAAAARFSYLALPSVLLLAVSGVGRAVAEVSTVSQLWTTGYGRSILAKTALFAVLIVLAALSRERITGAYTRLRASVASEAVVVVGVLLAVGFLTALPPARRVRRVEPATAAGSARSFIRLPLRDAVVVAQRDGRLAAAIAVRPTGSARATFVGPDGKTVDVGATMIAGRPANSCGIGCYVGTADYRGVVTVSHGASKLRFDLGRPRPAPRLVAAISRSYRRLRGAVYVQRIASGLAPGFVALWKETPTGYSYRLSNGSQAISIGRRRWDRIRGRSWKESVAVPEHGLTPPWGNTGRLTNAHIVSRGRTETTLSFLGANATYPAWFTVVLRRGTTRIVRLQMTAPAHFMHARYLSWNKPVVLRPPGGRATS